MRSATPRAALALFVSASLWASPALSAVSTGDEASLEAALEAVDAGDIQADLTFIASDELGGRDTPSSGLRVAARFVRARLERLGWKPGAGDGYFHEYRLARRKLDSEASGLTLVHGGEELALQAGSDYVFYSGLTAGAVGGELVYAGGGTREEVESAGVKGKWALVWDSNDRSLRRRLQEAGAKGFLVLHAPEGEQPSRAFRWGFGGGFRRLSSSGSLMVLAGEPPIRRVLLTSEASAQLLAHCGLDADAMPAAGTSLETTLTENRVIAEEEVEELENVAGFWPGRDPALRHEVILLSAHYDHVGIDGEDIYNGADDNGSGTVGLLAVAEALTHYGPMRRSVMLLWVSGEEKGLLGSEAWAREPVLPEGTSVVANINIDMIGRNDPDYLLITPTSDHEKYNGIVRLAERFAPMEGFRGLGSADEYYERSDQTNFERYLGIPVAFLFSDVHEDYHQPTDTIEKIDFDKIRRVVRLVIRLLDGLQEEQLLASPAPASSPVGGGF